MLLDDEVALDREDTAALAQVKQELQGVGPARYEVAAIDEPPEPHAIYYSLHLVPPPLQ